MAIITTGQLYTNTENNYTGYLDYTILTDTETFLSTIQYKITLYAPAATTVSRIYSGCHLQIRPNNTSGATTIYYDEYMDGLKLKSGLNTILSGELEDVRCHNTTTGKTYSGYPQLAFGFHFKDGDDTTTSIDNHYGSGSDYYVTNLPNIPRASTIVCSTAYLGDQATITVSQKLTSYYHKIDYVFGALKGSVTGITQATTIKWPLPINFLSQFGENELERQGTLTCTTYKDAAGTQVEGTTTCTFYALLDGDAAGPTIAPTVVDTNPATLALTGDPNIFIRYYSNAYIETNVAAQQGATLVSSKTTWGNQSFSGASGTILAIDTDRFTVEAMDSRGLSSVRTHILDKSKFIEYNKLTTNFISGVVETDGELKFNIQGNYYNGSFGATNNTLTVQYRYKEKDGSYGGWITASGTPSGSNYDYEVNLTGLNYRAQYIFQVRATDKIGTITGPEILVAGYPIFDWGKGDFDFNVPVHMNDHQVFVADAGIYGRDEYGDEVSALIPKDSSGNTVLGFGNYQDESGDTLIYGKNVNIMAAEDITVNGASLLGGTGITLANIVNALGNSYDFTAYLHAMGSNFSDASCSVTLRGNCLYCRVYGSRTNASNTGDFTDELVASFNFDHGGKITGMDYVTGVAGSSGPTAGLMIKNPQVDGVNAYFDLYLCNSAAAGRNFLAAFAIPVSIDLSKFAE